MTDQGLQVEGTAQTCSLTLVHRLFHNLSHFPVSLQRLGYGGDKNIILAHHHLVDIVFLAGIDQLLHVAVKIVSENTGAHSITHSILPLSAISNASISRKFP